MNNMMDKFFAEVTSGMAENDAVTAVVDTILSRILPNESAAAWCIRTQYSCGGCGIRYGRRLRHFTERCCGWLGCRTHRGCSYC